MIQLNLMAWGGQTKNFNLTILIFFYFFLYWSCDPHWSRDLVSPVCGIFSTSLDSQDLRLFLYEFNKHGPRKSMIFVTLKQEIGYQLFIASKQLTRSSCQLCQRLTRTSCQPCQLLTRSSCQPCQQT